jgi:hypothetical protein
MKKIFDDDENCNAKLNKLQDELENNRSSRNKITSIIIIISIGMNLLFAIFIPFTSTQLQQSEYNRGYANGFILGNSTGWEDGWLEGNETGWEDGWLEGNETGWLEGNSSGYILGFSDGYDIAYNLGYNQGYLDAFENNKIIFHGRSTGEIIIYNSASNSSTYDVNFNDLENSEIITVPSYDNESASINVTLSNIVLSNSTIIQDTFIETNSQSTYTASSSLTLYQQLIISNDCNLTSISFVGNTIDAKPNIRLYSNNNGIVGTLLATLYTTNTKIANGLKVITYNFVYPISIGSYFIGIRCVDGTIRISTSYGTGVNDVITLYGNALANIDYAINYTIVPPSYSSLSDFINHGILHAMHPNYASEFNFDDYIAEIHYHTIIMESCSIMIIWNWVAVSFDMELNFIYGNETISTENITLLIDSLAFRNNQSTNFWGGIDDGEDLPCDVVYYTTTDIECKNFGVTINEYSWRFDLAYPPIFVVGNEYNFTVTSMKATIYDVIGTTWVCNFEMYYTINDVEYYKEINHLYIFDVFRL